VLLSKHLQKQDWEYVFIKLHFCIDLMIVLVQAVPSHFISKLCPWLQ